MSDFGKLVNISLDGKPFEKLIEVVSEGIGTLYRPRKIRKEADANAYAIKVVGKAVAEADAEKKWIEADMQDRIVQRIAAQEIRRQNNIDTVVEEAAHNLEGKQVSEEPVSMDWSARFFGIVQDVSQEEMRMLWSKVLAGEIEKPSSFSMRTLETLRNISSEEAKLFEKVAPFILEQKDFFIYNDSEALKSLGVHYIDLAKLIECGLLQPGVFVTKNYTSNPDKESVACILCGKKVLLVKFPQASKEIDLPVILLSQAGCELYSLLDSEVNMDYVQLVAKHFKHENPAVKVEYSEVISVADGLVRYKTPVVEL